MYSLLTNWVPCFSFSFLTSQNASLSQNRYSRYGDPIANVKEITYIDSQSIMHVEYRFYIVTCNSMDYNKVILLGRGNPLPDLYYWYFGRTLLYYVELTFSFRLWDQMDVLVIGVLTKFKDNHSCNFCHPSCFHTLQDKLVVNA